MNKLFPSSDTEKDAKLVTLFDSVTKNAQTLDESVLVKKICISDPCVTQTKIDSTTQGAKIQILDTGEV